MDSDVSDNNAEEYLTFLDKTADWHRWHANKAMVLFIVLRLMLTVLSAALPALASRGADRLDLDYLTYAAVTIAVLAALDTQFKWGDEWRQYRTTQLSLERLARMFRNGAFAAELPEEKRFQKLVEGAETLMTRDAESFFRFRITSWKETG